MTLKFNRMGIYTREFYSEDLKFINCILKVQDPILVERAESFGMPV